MSKVSIVKCSNYEIDVTRQAVRESLANLGGISSFISPEETVLLKVNLLMKRRPEKVTTTHPAIVQAVAELVIEAGGKPIIGDSPGGYHFYNKTTLEAVYETCGMKDAAEKSGAELNYNTDIVDVTYPEGKITKSIKTIKPVIEVDKIISIPKIKTHMMTVYSGAVKNMFGIIPGRFKAECHLRFDNTADFSDFLIDIYNFSKPVLTIMDAVIGMEGYGPTNGSPKKLGFILSSPNAFELDAAAATMIDLKPLDVPTIRKSIERGLFDGNIDSIDIVGEDLMKIQVKDFKKPTLKVAFNLYSIFIPKPILKRINRFIKPKPWFNRHKCKGCRMCEKSCPAMAIQFVNGLPAVDISKCIRCFCCHELCNFDAVNIKRPWFLKKLLG
ncbi:MAG: DUF362 domain-containing protein [Bacillota bacterium]|nr:DUF362 domain-containing protein [Bacillota bacterium]